MTGTWGASLNNTAVVDRATFVAAITVLRSAAGHDPAAPWPRAAQWASVEAALATTDVALEGNPNATVAALTSVGVPPLVVTQISCSSFDFSTDDNATAAYWAERWELYKHQYVVSRWTWVRGIARVECASPAHKSPNRSVADSDALPPRAQSGMSRI